MVSVLLFLVFKTCCYLVRLVEILHFMIFHCVGSRKMQMIGLYSQTILCGVFKFSKKFNTGYL